MGDSTQPVTLPETVKRKRGRPPLSPEARAASRARKLAAKAERQRQRRASMRVQRERVANNLASASDGSSVSEKPAIAVARKPPAERAFEPTPEQRTHVTTLAGLGLRHDEIALLILNPITRAPIGEATLRNVFEHELAAGPAQANSQVSQSLYRMATGTAGVKRSTAAAIFWTKARMGWRETVHVEADIRAGVLVAPAGVSPEQWINAARSSDAPKLEPGKEVA